MDSIQTITDINQRPDLRTFHPDALPWPSKLDPAEHAFCSRVCGFPTIRMNESRAYWGKELAQLADIERHVSICLGLISGFASDSGLLGGVPMMNAMLRFAAEEYQHANMFYRYVELLIGQPLDLSGESLEHRLGLFLGPESPGAKLVALLASAYPGETVITLFEHRVRLFDPTQRHFATRMLVAHGLDEARHIQFDHYVLGQLAPSLDDGEWADARRLCRNMEAANHALAERYEARMRQILPCEFVEGNTAARIQRHFSQKLLRETLAGRTFRLADQALSSQDRALVMDFTGRASIHPGGGSTWH
ncbi:ferritin-like domain-containing protein [Mesoterricola sediminis]|uniref:Para-aminobenzoate N-oxygenase AurF n=1 Tax=Mesoterricola sediminis TaxID=2927980 RepID=A0AA48GXX6_9BACT|nr:ferritin-like domain-containing protein [Mesoterricola sediminis]BDU77650.1 hypothetical protein METESE_26080 [Mesoterricola sediminis]